MVMDKKVGLTSHEAKERLAYYGANTIVEKHRVSAVRAYLERLCNPLVIILLLAAIASLVMGEVSSGIVITTIILISTALDFVNAHRSEKAAQALSSSIKIKASVWRDNKLHQINPETIVPGDIVSVYAGSLIPADGEVVNANSLSVDESSLTGESYPVGKLAGQSVYMGSSVNSGDGLIRITATGHNTEYCQIAKLLRTQNTTEFDREIARFSTLIARLTFGLVLFILAASLLLKHNTVQALLFALALAVGLTPELLPLIITANLTRGSLRMAKRGAIVKRLSAIQDFGAMDVLCTDKTGTLTENQIEVARTEDIYHTESARALELAAAVCHFTTSYETPMDKAILDFRSYRFDRYHKIYEIPYDFSRRRESVVVKIDHQTRLITKGAADSMMSLLAKFRAKNGEASKLTESALAELEMTYRNLSQEGYRILMVASRDIEPCDNYDTSNETDLTFEGFVVFVDPPKHSAAASLKRLMNNGISIKIITGDDPLVAQHVATELNLPIQGILTGDQISHLNHLQLARKAETTTIFARVNPSQKLAIVQALRRHHTVGYLGDGINDAPSLRCADVGISVNNATDVAKDTADIVLMSHSLEYLNDGVMEGRRTFTNTMKYLQMALSSNFGNMISMAGASLILPFLPMTASQILLNNLLYDSSQFAIPSDQVDPEQIDRPQRLSIHGLKHFMLVFGIISSLFDLLTFAIMLKVLHTDVSEFQTGWFIESLLTQILVVFIVRTHRFAIASRPAKVLIASVTIVAIIAILIAYTSLGRWFGFSVLSPTASLVLGSIIAAYLMATEAVKHIFYAKTRTPNIPN